MSRISPAATDSSLELGELKSYLTLACGVAGAFAGDGAGAGGGGGGGGVRVEETDSLRVWAGVPLTWRSGAFTIAAAGTGRLVVVAAAAGAGLGRDATFDGAPLGPPGRNSLPLVMGLAMTLERGVGLETELGDSPWPTWIVPDL